MAIDIKSPDGLAVRKLIPLATLSNLHFEALCMEITVEEAGKGAVLFKKGDDDQDLVYLLSGEVFLQAQGLFVEAISAGSVAAQFSLAHQNPRQVDAVANTDIRYVNVKRDLLDNPPTVYYEEEENNYLVTEVVEQQPDDWMTNILKSPVFQRLPAANLQQILLGFQEVRFHKEEIIVEQGQKDDYYYLIKKGQCLLTRKPTPTAKPIKLAKFRSNDSFGEDSLISGSPSNFSITAITDISLLRLPKEKFITLIKEPLLSYIDFKNALQQQKQGATLIDVRLPDDYQANHVDGSINTPFFSLRMQVKNLDRSKKVIVICADGKLSEAAAFYLIKCNFQALILKGGMKNIPPEEIKKPPAKFDISDVGGNILDHVGSIEPNDQPAADDEFEEDLADYETDISNQLSDLITENEILRQSNQLLTQKYAKLLAEKKLLEQQLKAINGHSAEL